MIRRAVLLTLGMSLLSGCGVQSLPTSNVGMARIAAMNAQAAAPMVRTVAAPSVSIIASETVAPAIAAESQDAAVDLNDFDTNLEALDLIAEDANAGYKVQGILTTIKDKITAVKDTIVRTIERHKLSEEVRKALKNTKKQKFDLLETEVNEVRKNSSTPVTHVNPLDAGANEIVSTWVITNTKRSGLLFKKTTYTQNVETRRVVDAAGVTQSLSMVIKGLNKDGLKFETSRVRTLVGTDGTYQVVTKDTLTLKDGRTHVTDWTKTVKVDGSEVLRGMIKHPEGHKTELYGTRDAKGHTDLKISKIADIPAV